MPRTHRGFSTRRGRPATPRSDRDYGTPELASKRNQGITAEVIDRLYKNGTITERELHCALHFRWLYRIRFGNSTLQAVDFTRHHPYTPPAYEDSPVWKEQRNAEYRTIAHALQQRGLLSVMLRIAVFNDGAILQPRHSLIIKRLFMEALHFLRMEWDAQRNPIPH